MRAAQPFEEQRQIRLGNRPEVEARLTHRKWSSHASRFRLLFAWLAHEREHVSVQIVKVREHPA